MTIITQQSEQDGWIMATNGRNAEYTKEYNRKKFLRLVRHQPMSRAELARQLGVTRAATSLIADELLREGWIMETAPTGTGVGRTPVPLALHPEAGYAVGVYLNRNGCTAGIVSMDGRICVQERIHLDDTLNKVVHLADAIRKMSDAAQIPWDRILGVGISAPGPLDGESGRIINPPKFDLWHNVDIGTHLGNALGLPVYLENDATCLARYNHGKPETKGSENFLLLLVDSGVGSGLILNGKVLKGAGYFTGELGHISIDLHGNPCPCGNIGCLETYAAIPNLLRGTGFRSWKQVIENKNDTAAAMLIQREAEYLSAAIASLINIVSLDTVLLAGELLFGAEEIAPMIEEMVNRRIMRRSIMPVRVLSSHSNPNATVLAAADVVFGRYLSV